MAQAVGPGPLKRPLCVVEYETASRSLKMFYPESVDAEQNVVCSAKTIEEGRYSTKPTVSDTGSDIIASSAIFVLKAVFTRFPVLPCSYVLSCFWPRPNLSHLCPSSSNKDNNWTFYLKALFWLLAAAALHVTSRQRVFVFSFLSGIKIH